MPKTKRKRPAVDFAALAELAERLRHARNPAWIRILLSLGDGVRSIRELAAEYGCKSTTLSNGLALMKAAGLIEGDRDGQRHVYSLTDAGRELLGVIEAIGARTLASPGPRR
jgi:DNA-binding HxlR family transcriptional regulator